MVNADKKSLKELGDIQIGYQHREKVSPLNRTEDGTHRIVQIKDLDLDGKYRAEVLSAGGLAPYVWLKGLSWVTPKGDADRYQVKRGDVLFLSRGQRAFAIPVLESIENTIASYYFYILRPDNERVLPEYLAWFINQPSSQLYLESHQVGSHMKMVSKQAFEELEIAIPPLATQRVIVELERLRQKEEYTLDLLLKARKNLINSLAFKAATSEN
jgi:hypothetical protein